MPAKNSIKIYAEDSFYHIYNRGVDKRDIFSDPQDFAVFLSYLKTYLTSKDEQLFRTTIASIDTSIKEKDTALKLLRLKNYYGDIELHCHALLPNHFHLLIRQRKNVIQSFMNALGTRYSMYFNRKHKRVGVLFQDVYKAVRVETDEQLLHLSRYINMNVINALNLSLNQWNETQLPSSLPEYLGTRTTSWIHTKYILDYFSTKNPNLDYQTFLTNEFDELSTLIIKDVGIDLEDE